MKILKLALVAFLAASSAQAHQFLTLEKQGKYSVGFWADDHWGEFANADVIGVSAYGKDGKKLKTGYDYDKNELVFLKDASPAMSVVMYDFGYWSFTQKQHFNKPRNEISGAIFDSRKNIKFGKTIFAWNETFAKPVGLKLEMTPLQNPLKLKEGDKLKVLITLDGKPFDGVGFEDQVDDLDDVVIKDGVATLPIRKAQDGLSIIAAGAKLPYYIGDPLAQTLQLTCTLSFKQAK